MGKRTITQKEDGSVEMHLRFYPGKYEAHRIFVERVRKYQEIMGVGPSDALAAMLYSKEESQSESISGKKDKQASQEQLSGKTGKREGTGSPTEHTKKPAPEAGSLPSHPNGYEESLFLGSEFKDSDLFDGEL